MIKTTAISFLFLIISSCTFKPFVDARREAGSEDIVGISTPDYPAVCYNSHYTTPKEVYEMADKECAKTGRKAEFFMQTKFTCKLFIPNHAIYRCVGGQAQTP
ncbi:MAG: hypothetical protein AB7U85_06990 [Alphaproteobacteria bacterium]